MWNIKCGKTNCGKRLGMGKSDVANIQKDRHKECNNCRDFKLLSTIVKIHESVLERILKLMIDEVILWWYRWLLSYVPQFYLQSATAVSSFKFIFVQKLVMYNVYMLYHT